MCKDNNSYGQRQVKVVISRIQSLKTMVKALIFIKLTEEQNEISKNSTKAIKR